ncbi:MAG: Fe-S cluster assembly protein SufD, partial [Candidatus Marinimicrobia bacterium]|nr:Fe-S cluster assembly protein SufD [Candidatus Neomarinimicrobiota bacterium]
MATVTTKNGLGFTLDRALELSEAKGEPGWLRELRERAWKAWENIPMPTLQDEEWRRTDISNIDFGNFQPYGELNGHEQVSVENLPDATKSLIERPGDRAGYLVQGDSKIELTELSEELRSKGVIFTSLDSAIQEHPDLVKQYLFSEAIAPEYSKFAALNGAFWTGGAFLYVPKNVEVDIPVEALFSGRGSQMGLFQHTLIVVDTNASAQFVEVFQSEDGHGETLSSGITEMYLNDNARLNFTSVQNWNENVYEFSNKRAHIGRDAHLTSVVGSFGGKLSKYHIDSICAGQGAHADNYGLYFLNGTQHLDTGVLLKLDTSHTSGESVFKGALKDKSRSVFQGLIKIEKGAQQTDAELENKNMLLNEGARADSIPVLEILADDV